MAIYTEYGVLNLSNDYSQFSELKEHYNDEFYASQSPGSLKSAQKVLRSFSSKFEFESVVDVGCGVGTWLAAAKEIGAKRLLGVDGSYVNLKSLRVPESDFIGVDIESTNLSDLADERLSNKFDLAISLEVAEHLSFARSESFVRDLSNLADVILFSAAIPFQGGENHLNEQWPEFWAVLFRANGYECYDFLRDEFWHDPEVAWWYAQNILVFARKGKLVDLKPRTASLSRVHPLNYLDQITKWFHTHRFSAAREEIDDFSRISVTYTSGESIVPKFSAIERAANAAPSDRNVFPFTRQDRFFPEERIRDLEKELRVATERSQNLEFNNAELKQTAERLQTDLERTLVAQSRVRLAVDSRLSLIRTELFEMQGKATASESEKETLSLGRKLRREIMRIRRQLAGLSRGFKSRSM